MKPKLYATAKHSSKSSECVVRDKATYAVKNTINRMSSGDFSKDYARIASIENAYLTGAGAKEVEQKLKHYLPSQLERKRSILEFNIRASMGGDV